MKSYRFTRTAKRDFFEITEQVVAANSYAGLKFVIELHQQFDRISAYPNIGRTRAELREDLRSLAYGKYIIFYRVADEVEIVRFLHGAQDIDGSYFQFED
jgi:toxin ParE1/3/4